MYTVQRFPYCGLSMPRVEFETVAEAREYVAGLTFEPSASAWRVSLNRQQWDIGSRA